MGMPQFPERKSHPNVTEIVLELLESVAIEELALAHLLNAEGEKTQELIKKYAYNDLCATSLNKLSKSTQSLLNSIIIKEWILLNKVNAALEIYQTMDADNSNCCSCHKKKKAKERGELC